MAGSFSGGGVQLGTGFVTVVPNAQGFGKALSKILGDETEDSGKQSSKQYEKGFGPAALAKRLGDGLKGTFGNIVTGIGQQAGQLMAQAISGGFDRLKAIDAAGAKLRGLGMDAETSAQVMANALASVKGTAFGMGEAATTAASMVAAGIQPGDDLERVLKGVANAAAATNSSMGDMGSIFGKVATTNKATNESLLQVADRGLPIYQKLAEQLGVTTSDVEKMASKGEINFEQFSAAATAAAGTVATELGNTATGSVSNFWASLSRLGAAALGGVFEGIGPAFGEFTTWIDNATESIKPFAQELGAKLVEKGQQAITWIKDDAVPTIKSFADTVGDVIGWVKQNKDWLAPLIVGVTSFTGALYAVGTAKKAFDAVMTAGGLVKYIANINLVKTLTTGWAVAQKALNAVMRMNPIGLVVAAVAALAAGLVYAYNNSETFRRIVDNAFAKVKEIAQSVADWFTGPFADFFKAAWDKISGFFTAAGQTIGTGINGIKGFFTSVSDAWTAVGDAIGLGWDWITGRFTAAVEWVTNTFGPWWDRLNAILVLPINLAQTLIGLAWDWITGKFSAVWTWVSTTFTVWWNTIRDKLAGPLNAARDWLGITWDSITGKFDAVWAFASGWVFSKWNSLTGMLGGALDAGRDWIGNTWNTITGLFSNAWDFVSGWASGKWNQLAEILKWPVDRAREGIDAAIGGIRWAFEAAVGFIRNVWEGIIEAVKRPIRFVMTTVIDNGLIAGFNRIADFANSPRLSPITPPGFASGGFIDLPWSASNRDPYLGMTPNGPIRFEGQEFIVNRDATRRNRGLLEAINADRYQDGGFLGGLASGAGSLASSALAFLRDPGKALGNIVDNLIGGMAGNPILSLMVGIPRKIVEALAGWVKSKLSFGTGSVWSGGLPTAGVITSPYGYRNGPFNGFELHDGIDIGAPLGTPVHTPLPGVVTQAGWAGGYGNMVTLNHGGFTSFYAHLQTILATVGQIMAAGQVLGLVGSTGWSTGPHLHWGSSLGNPLQMLGYANGTNSARRGLAWVGERGPELVDFRGGERVWSAQQSRGMTALPDRITLVAEDGTMLGVFRTVAGDVVRTALAPASSGALTSRLGGV